MISAYPKGGQPTNGWHPFVSRLSNTTDLRTKCKNARMMDAQTPAWREELTRLSRHDDFLGLPSSVRAGVAALLAAPQISDEEAESLLTDEPELRALYRRIHAAPVGGRGDVLDPVRARKRPDRRWECPEPTCDYEDWGDRLHPARQDYCPRTNHPPTLLRLIP
jgi:hypothetical protein